jgi:fructokinase
MTAHPVICVGGENLIDHVTRDGAQSALAGGSPFNVAMALGRQQADVRYVTPISTDAWGDHLADTLTSSNVTLSGGRSDAPTTIARVTVRDGIPDYQFERDGTAERAVTPAFLQEVIPAGTAALHTGSLALTMGADAEAWEKTCAAAFESGTLVSLDPNVRMSVINDAESYRARIYRMLEKIDLLKLSDEDLGDLYPDMTQQDALDLVRETTTARLVVITRGPDGAEAWCGDIHIKAPAPRVPGLVDTVGAGDTFMATLLAGLARIGALSQNGLGKLTRPQVADLVGRAGCAAAINCSRAGCNPPTLDELDRALSEAD